MNTNAHSRKLDPEKSSNQSNSQNHGLAILKTDLLADYLAQVNNLKEKFEALKDAEISTDTFSFYTSVASVFSSKIEGEEIELDRYIKHKAIGIKFLPIPFPWNFCKAAFFAFHFKLSSPERNTVFG